MIRFICLLRVQTRVFHIFMINLYFRLLGRISGDLMHKIPYLFTISPSSNYLLREIKQSKKQSRQSAQDLIKAVSCATKFFLCLCLQAQAYKSG